MKLNSPLFDRIRVKPGEDRRLRPDCPGCDWPGCTAQATHRAPKGRLREQEYWRFCLDHVREYNQAYNYFAGMSEDAVTRYQKEAITGHRPTWKMGLGKRPGTSSDDSAGIGGATDPFGMFHEFGAARFKADFEPARPERPLVRNAERKALEALGLEVHASAQEIKVRFKMLVKRHHPDANGGDRSCEQRLREIIQAYNYLKSARRC